MRETFLIDHKEVSSEAIRWGINPLDSLFIFGLQMMTAEKPVKITDEERKATGKLLERSFANKQKC